ncbi:MAG: SIR2 family NAD-dependent protein deacylase [Chitinophagales bacterium]
MKRKKIVILTGAGISAESGIQTFRGAGGLWNGHKVEDVASPAGFRKNPTAVLQFYNERRKDAAKAQPNLGHKALVELEKKFDVTVITQNVDDLHERAGSTNVLHLHGKLSEVRSSKDKNLIYDYKDRPIFVGDKCELGSQLRPNIVWFGEDVPMISKAIQISSKADIFIVIGTSLAVYPAASLIGCPSDEAAKVIIDPNFPEVGSYVANLKFIGEKATVGVPYVVENLLLDADFFTRFG